LLTKQNFREATAGPSRTSEEGEVEGTTITAATAERVSAVRAAVPIENVKTAQDLDTAGET